MAGDTPGTEAWEGMKLEEQEVSGLCPDKKEKSLYDLSAMLEPR